MQKGKNKGEKGRMRGKYLRLAGGERVWWNMDFGYGYIDRPPTEIQDEEVKKNVWKSGPGEGGKTGLWERENRV